MDKSQAIKLLIISVSVIISLILLYFIYWQLPPSVNRRSEIELGNKIVEKIEKYKNENNQLPRVYDWKILENLGFRIYDSGSDPTYLLLSDTTYILIFPKGFDGPYLMWKSSEKKWEMDFYP